MRQSIKTKKLITKIWIGIAILLVAIASAFLFSEKVHKIEIVGNVEKALVGQEVTEEQGVIITKDVDKTIANIGETITYTITVKNFTTETIQNMQIKDVLAPQLEWIGASYSWTAPYDGPDDGMIHSNQAGTSIFSSKPDNGMYKISHEMCSDAEVILNIVTRPITYGIIKNTAIVIGDNMESKESNEVETEVLYDESYEAEYTIEYYYDNIRDNSRREIRNTKASNSELKQKIEINLKDSYTFEKYEDCTSSYNVIKIYYKSENSVPIEPTDPETGKRLYTITIENDKSGHTYNSYQVFQGDYYEEKDDNGNKKAILSNIEWGPELQKEAEEGKNHGDKIIEALKTKNEEIYKDCKTAADVAEKLQGKENDGDIIREFTAVVGKYLLDNNITLTKGTDTLIEEKDINGNVIKSNYKIDKLEPGYYVVIDAKANAEDDAYSRYLIDVVQDVTMEPKSSIPTLTKIVKSNQAYKMNEDGMISTEKTNTVNTATYKENGDYDIDFEIVTTIPEDLETYGANYRYEIVDILDKGFDCCDNSNVKIYLGEEMIPYAESNYDLNIETITEANYESKYKEYFAESAVVSEQYGKTMLTINVKDLPGQVSRNEVVEGQKLTIEYKAKLNGKGDVGNTPNINEAYLKYSNDPYKEDSTTKTKTAMTLTYTIDLNINKIAKIETALPELKYLSGAEFEVYDKPFSLVTSREKITTMKEKHDTEGNIIGEIGKLTYSSLGAGEYYIKETKSPDGYNKLIGEIKIEIKAVYDGVGINWLITDNTGSELVTVNSDSKINIQVQNTSGFDLPVTGGIGTVIFTLTGLSIMALAVVSLKSNKKK